MDVDSNHINSRERFFSIPPNADPVLMNLVDRLKEREAKQPFVDNFIKYEGYPIWKNALISFGNKNNTSNITADGAIDTLVSIPIVPDSAVYVKSILKVKISTDLLFKLYQRASYALNGFDNDPARTKSNANDIVAEIMMFEKEIFNLQNLFIIKDPRLFTIRPDTVSSSDPFFVSASRASLCTIEVHWTTMTPVYDASGCLKDMEYENHYEHYNTVCTDGGEGWGPDPSGPYSAGGGGEIPPAPLPPCNPGWDRITVSHNFKYFEGDCTPQTPIPIDPPISNIDLENPSDDFEFNFPLGIRINLNDYFNCFTQIPDAGASYSVSISADLPVNTHSTWLANTSAEPGHSFITLIKTGVNGNTIAIPFGFYPTSGPKSILSPDGTSEIHNNSNHEANATYTMSGLSSTQFLQLQHQAISAQYHLYSLSNYNCTNYAVDVINVIRPNNPIIVPDWLTNFPSRNWGSTPNGLYNILSSMGGQVGTFHAPFWGNPC